MYAQGSGVPLSIHLLLNQEYFSPPNQPILESALVERKIKASFLMLIGGIVQVFPIRAGKDIKQEWKRSMISAD